MPLFEVAVLVGNVSDDREDESSDAATASLRELRVGCAREGRAIDFFFFFFGAYAFRRSLPPATATA